ncbi:hypothetical protein MD484_g3365, partial [Candolleomyces efflorescens]
MASASGNATQSTRRILVDDTSAQILYSADWTVNSQGIQSEVGDFGSTFQQTLHGTPHPFGNLSFTFEGSSAVVYGIVSMMTSTSFEVEPIWECFIDGESSGTPTKILTNQNRQKLCQFDELDSSEAHTLAVNTNGNQQLFWVDYIEYTPSSTANFTGAFVSIQHDDPLLGWGYGKYIIYRYLFVFGNFERCSDHSVGTAVSWYGAIPSDAPRTPSAGTYSIDGQSATAFSIRRTPSTENSTSPPSLFNQLFFETPLLPFGDHNITVTYTSSGIPLSLDHLVIRNSSIHATTIDSAPPQPVAASSKAPSTPKIVGAVFGGGTAGETGQLVNRSLSGFHRRIKQRARRGPLQGAFSRVASIRLVSFGQDPDLEVQMYIMEMMY